ncbi:MAG: M48 family metallopeptidase [Cyanobacteria bacterium P01_H01_bin.74]
MQVSVEESLNIKQASARQVSENHVDIRLPAFWSDSLKSEIIEKLLIRLQRQNNREKSLLASVASQAHRTFHSVDELLPFVININNNTFQAKLGPIQIGSAKYSRLAQLNTESKVMTISSYCIKNVPETAIRYLIVHELAHYFQHGHGIRFWKLVSRYVPDYKLQSRIIKAVHHQAVLKEQAALSVSLIS